MTKQIIRSMKKAKSGSMIYMSSVIGKWETQASRISGINPSDVQILMVYMGR